MISWREVPRLALSQLSIVYTLFVNTKFVVTDCQIHHLVHVGRKYIAAAVLLGAYGKSDLAALCG